MILLLEPQRAPGFVSGGYRYQDEIMPRLAARGEGERRAIAPRELPAVVARTRQERRDTVIVVDGLFIALTQEPLPAEVTALLHVVPGRTPWATTPPRVIATSQRTADAVRTAVRSVTVVRPGLDPCFVPGPARAASARLRIVCVGTISPGKGQHLLAASLAHSTTAARCELVLIGDENEHRDHVAAVRVAAKSVPLQVRCGLSPVGVASELQHADLFVSASRRESFGMAVAEAAACAVPVLAFDTGEISSFVQDGRNGWLLPPDATDAEFAARLAQVLTDPVRLTAARSDSMRPPLQTWESVARSFARACRA
ncbi:MAG TPA: glycosyltransferase [Planctomycetota bacterium]|nr:glycosyltransferase [Planctomycetota bacterium]